MQIQLNVQYCIGMDQYFLFFSGITDHHLTRDIVRDIIYESRSAFMMFIFMNGYKNLDTALMCLMMLVDFLEEQPDYFPI